MSVVVSSVYNTNNVNAGKFAGSEPWSVVNAGICSHSSGAGAVPVMDFEGKVVGISSFTVASRSVAFPRYCIDNRILPSRGALKGRSRVLPLGPKNTKLSVFLPLNYMIFVFATRVLKLFAVWKDRESL